MDLGLKRHVVVVTGGANGIGRAVAEGFVAEGARVALWDVAENVVQIAGELGPSSECQTAGFTVDLTDMGGVVEALKRTESKLGPIQHLVHCAAVGSDKFGFPFTNLEPADWPRVLEINVMGMVNVAHVVAPGLIERATGTLLFISSVAGQIGSQTDPPYSASKAANINFAQCLAKDLAPHRVRVNTLCPGMVQTALNKSVWRAWNDQQPADAQRTYEDWAGEKVRTIVPLGKWQRPQDIADMAVFLSSKRAAHVTGQTINVDGGYVMHW